MPQAVPLIPRAVDGIVAALLEPVMYWPDARNVFHERMLDARYLAKLPSYSANPEAAVAVAAIRGDLAEAFMQAAAVSFQLGKFYLFQQGRESSAQGLLGQLKRLLDPEGRMHPGAQGLGG